MLTLLVLGLGAPRLWRRFNLRAPSVGTIVDFEAARYHVVEAPLQRTTVRLRRTDGGTRLHGPGLARTNAGIFEPDLTPTGLLISGGRELHPLNLRKGAGNFFLEPNGVFFITASGAHVVETSEFRSEGVLEATQSGPLLLRAGGVHPSFKPGSTHRAIRNGVGVRRDGTVVLVISRDEVSLFDFAVLFRDVLGCTDALYLDGVISGLAVEGSTHDEDTGPFAAAIVVEQKLSAPPRRP
jgi:uncharacterized protein YigE (DUF2233 family)